MNTIIEETAGQALLSALKPYRILDRLSALRAPAALVCDETIAAVLPEGPVDAAPRLSLEEVIAGRLHAPAGGPYFVITEGNERAATLALRRRLARRGLFPQIFGVLHDLMPAIGAEIDTMPTVPQPPALELLAAQPAFAIVCSPRSGSQYLSREMTNFGLGHPLEHIRPQVIDLMKALEGGRVGRFDFTDWFASIMAFGTENGVFGTKLISHFIRDIEINATPREWAMFSEFLARIPAIYLVRENKLLQALSRDRAKATRRYHLFDEKKRSDYVNESSEWTYDFERIGREVKALHQEEGYLAGILQTLSRTADTLVLPYETLDVEKAIAFVEGALEVKAKPRSAAFTTNILRDEKTTEFAERFRTDYAAALAVGGSAAALPVRVIADPETLALTAIEDPEALDAA